MHEKKRKEENERDRMEFPTIIQAYYYYCNLHFLNVLAHADLAKKLFFA